MYVKSQTVRKADGKCYTYYRLVESYREGGQVKHRIMAQLGRLTQEEAARLSRRFAQIAGRSDQPREVEDRLRGVESLAEQMEVNGCQYFGAPLLVEQLMERIGLAGCVQSAVEPQRVEFDVVAVLKVMVCAHLFKSDSRSELAVWDWQQKLFGHPHRVGDLAYQHLLRALSVLVQVQQEVEEHLFFRLVDLFSIDVDLVFYDLTSTYVEGRAPWSRQLQRGYSRDQRGDCKQVVIGLVVTREGFPVTCRVFDGNTLDQTTLKAMVQDLQKRFAIRRCVWVSDAGLLSQKNLELLEQSGYEYILGAGTGARKDVQAAVAQTKGPAQAHVNGVSLWSVSLAESFPGCDLPKRLIVLESEGRREKTAAILERRLQRVREGLSKLEQRVLAGRLKDREGIRLAVEKVLHRSGVKKYFSYRAQPGSLHWEEDTQAVVARKAQAGKYALLAKTDLPAEEVLSAYRTLLAAEDAFRVLKDELDLRPLWHKCDVNVQGHVLLAMWSYLLYKVLAVQLERHKVDLPMPRALQAVKEVRAVEVALREQPIWKLMKVPAEAEQVFAALGIDNLKGRFHEWAQHAAPYHYTPRLHPWKSRAHPAQPD